MEEMKCVYCNSVADEIKETNVFNHYTDDGKIDKTLLIKNMPTFVCSNHECNEEFYDAEVIEKVQNILKKVADIDGEYFIADFETDKVFKMAITEEI